MSSAPSASSGSAAPSRRITFVKKIKADGSPCRKCADVAERLQQVGLLGRIDHVAIADERDPNSEGMQLAARYRVEAAPFFLVEENGQTTVYTSYFKFQKEVLGKAASEKEEIAEIQDQNDLDFI